MRIGRGNGLILLIILVAVLIITIVSLSFNVLRIILAIPLLIFFPGYSLLAALFAKKGELDGITRVALSVVLSVAVVPLIGLILNYTPWGIRLEPILYSLGLFILITSIIAWLRQRTLAEHERFTIRFQMTMPGWGEHIWHRVITIILGLSILGAFGMLGYIGAKPKVEETFTNFYILGPEGKAENYPRELKIGEAATVILGTANNEGKEVSYRVAMVVNGEKWLEIGPAVLADREKLETKVIFALKEAGRNQKVEFLLYKDDEVEPCLEPLFLWINVIE